MQQIVFASETNLAVTRMKELILTIRVEKGGKGGGECLQSSSQTELQMFSIQTFCPSSGVGLTLLSQLPPGVRCEV